MEELLGYAIAWCNIPAALLMARIGRRGGFWTGAGLGACRGINLASIAEGNFWAANALLGIGWNLLFIGGTTPLTRTHRPEERAKVQALNDFLIFGTSTVSSGALLAGSGWTRYNPRPCHLSPWRSRRSCGFAGTARARSRAMRRISATKLPLRNSSGMFRRI